MNKRNYRSSGSHPKSYQGGNSAVVNISEEEFRELFYDPYDATRDYADRFREDGRFGSHPLHDDYDDK